MLCSLAEIWHSSEHWWTIWIHCITCQKVTAVWISNPIQWSNPNDRYTMKCSGNLEFFLHNIYRKWNSIHMFISVHSECTELYCNSCEHTLIVCILTITLYNLINYKSPSTVINYICKTLLKTLHVSSAFCGHHQRFYTFIKSFSSM
jgi:hypothetical protein